MVLVRDCGISKICEDEEMIIVDTSAFNFSRYKKSDLFFADHASKEVEYLSKLVEVARNNDSFYVPSTVLSEIHRGINVIMDARNLIRTTANLRREFRELGRVIYPKEHLDHYKELKTKLLPLKDTFGLSSVDLDVLVCSLEVSSTVRTGMVTDDKYIIYAYLMIQNCPRMSVYSRLWTNGSNNFERLSKSQLRYIKRRAIKFVNDIGKEDSNECLPVSQSFYTPPQSLVL